MHSLKTIICLLPLLLAAAMGCTTDRSKPVPVSRLDRALADYKDATPRERVAMADTLGPEIDAFFRVLGYDSVGESELEWWSAGDEVELFQPDVDAAFPDLAALESTIGVIYANANRLGLPLDSLRFASVVYGKPMPLVRVDSVMLIALNHYLGADYPGYSHWEAYKRAEKTPAALPYDLAAAIVSTTYPMAASDSATLLSNLLYEGALVEARMRLLPDADLASALGTTPEGLKAMQQGLPQMWREISERKMLYDTNQLTSDRLLSAAPSSPLLNGEAPARAGRYVGYSIVKSYLKSHPQATLTSLFDPAFYANHAAVAQSAFNPK